MQRGWNTYMARSVAKKALTHRAGKISGDEVRRMWRKSAGWWRRALYEAAEEQTRYVDDECDEMRRAAERRRRVRKDRAKRALAMVNREGRRCMEKTFGR